MKMTLSAITLATSLLVSPLYAASSCLADINSYQMDNTLWLRQCDLKDSDAPALLTWLDAHKEVTMLILQENGLGKDGAKTLAKNTTLDSMGIVNNKIEAEGMIAIAQNTNLKGIFAYGAGIGDAGLAALAHDKSIHEIEVGDDSFSSAALQDLAQNTTINILSLTDIKLDKAALEAFSNNKTLENVNFTDCSLDATAAGYLAKMPAVKLLNLYDNKLGDEGALAISKNPNIVALDLSANNLKPASGSYIATMPSLIAFYGDENNLGDQGAMALAGNTKFVELSIMDNAITDIGAKALTALTNLNVLGLSDQKKFLKGDGIGDEGTIAIATTTTMKNLSMLLLDGNNIHDASVDALSKMTLDELDVSRNHLSSVGIVTLKNSPTIKSVDADNNDGVKLAKAHAELNKVCAHVHSSAMCKSIVNLK